MDPGINYTLTVHVYNSLQYVNVVTALLGGLLISVTLFIGLFHNRATTLNHYKNIILILSACYCLTCMCYLPLLPVYSYPSTIVYALGKYYWSWLSYTLAASGDLLQKVGNILLAVSMIYKVISLTRPEWLHYARFILIALTIPPPAIQIFVLQPTDFRLWPVCDLICSDETGRYYPRKIFYRDMSERNVVSNILDYILYAAVVCTGIPCCLILNRWFKEGQFSPKTIKIQRSLMKAWMLLIVLHSFVFLPQLYTWIDSMLPDIAGVEISAVVISGLNALLFWAISLKILVIFFTVRKLLFCPKWLKNVLDSNGLRRRSITPIH